MNIAEISRLTLIQDNLDIPGPFEEDRESAMSSLQTLLDAAKFVECTNTPDRGARAPDPPEFHHYAKSPPDRNHSDSFSARSDVNDDKQDRRKYGGAGTREVHNILEKNRRAHLKECFDSLKMQVPTLENHNKVSNLSILRGALKYIQMLKRKENELEEDVSQLTLEKLHKQQHVTGLQHELTQMNVCVDMTHFMPPPDEDTQSVSTTTAHNGSPIMSEDENTEIHHCSKENNKCDEKLMPILTFCNIFNTTSSKPQQLVTNNTIATDVNKAPPVNPGMTSYTASHNHANTVRNNKTIADMLSSSSAAQFHSTSVGEKKTSVTQLLQQTIVQRQAQLQQLAKLQHQAQQAALVVSGLSPSTIATSINVGQLTQPQVIAMDPGALRPVMSALKPVSLNHILPAGFTLSTTNVPQSTASTSIVATVSLPANLSNTNADLTATAGSVTVPALSALQAVTLSELKPILTVPMSPLPGRPLDSQQVTTLKQLMSDAVAKSSAFRAADDSTSGGTTLTTTSHVSKVTPSGLTPLTLSQFLPINMVIPPNSTRHNAALNQVNLANTAINSELLNSLSVPILQQPISVPLKPLVMVTIANTGTPGTVPLTTGTSSTFTVNLPFTQS